MTKKPLVYLETSIVSYLTSRPSRDLVSAARQEMTHEWWEQRKQYDIFVSELVVEEAQEGNAEAAARRVELIDQLPLLETSREALSLAEGLLEKNAVPPQAPRDALHIGIATAHDVDLLLTWNFRHIANAWKREAIRKSLESSGYRAPVIATPEDLLEEE